MKVKPLSYREVIKKARKLGFSFRRSTSCSHEIWWNEKTKNTKIDSVARPRYSVRKYMVAGNFRTDGKRTGSVKNICKRILKHIHYVQCEQVQDDENDGVS